MAIDSMLGQTFTNFELLIADDCSTDRTKEIIDSYTDSRIKTYHNNVNQGYLKASNLLFEKCKGAYITFQDADDYSDKRRLQLQLDFLNENSDYACVGSNIIKVDTQSKELFKTNYPLLDNEIRKGFVQYKIVFTGSALMIRKGVFDKLGFYNEYFDRIGSEDTYLFSLILDHFKVANLKEALYYYRTNPNSVGATHKNPKAKFGHVFILELYQRRKQHKSDYLLDGAIADADHLFKVIMCLRNDDRTFKDIIRCYFGLLIRHPKVGIQYLRLYLSSLWQRLMNSN